MPEIDLWNWDKLAHTFVYIVLAILLFRYLYLGKGVAFSAVSRQSVLIGTGYGLFDELHQLFIPNRSCTWQDMLADIIGVGLGVYLAAKFYKRKQKHENPPH